MLSHLLLERAEDASRCNSIQEGTSASASGSRPELRRNGSREYRNHRDRERVLRTLDVERLSLSRIEDPLLKLARSEARA
jgi:hypothetical protein